MITASFSNDDGNGNGNGNGNENVKKKTIGLLSKTTSLHVHHPFVYISYCTTTSKVEIFFLF